MERLKNKVLQIFKKEISAAQVCVDSLSNVTLMKAGGPSVTQRHHEREFSKHTASILHMPSCQQRACWESRTRVNQGPSWGKSLCLLNKNKSLATNLHWVQPNFAFIFYCTFHIIQYKCLHFNLYYLHNLSEKLN